MLLRACSFVCDASTQGFQLCVFVSLDVGTSDVEGGNEAGIRIRGVCMGVYINHHDNGCSLPRDLVIPVEYRGDIVGAKHTEDLYMPHCFITKSVTWGSSDVLDAGPLSTTKHLAPYLVAGQLRVQLKIVRIDGMML